MKLKILKSKFAEGMRSVQNIVNGKASPVIMQNVKIETTEDGKLRMTTSDLDISVESVVECEVEEPGVTTLPVKILSAAVSCSSEGVMNLEVDESDKASLRAGSAKYRLSGLSASLFPQFPKNEGSYTYTLKQVTLKEMLRKTAYAASQDDTRRNLKGVLMRFKDSKLTLVATDGRRMALVEKEEDFAADAEQDIVLPNKTVQELQRSLSSEGEVNITVQNSQARFTLGNVTIYTKLAAEPFPNYAQVIPISFEQQITVDRLMLISAVERVGVMSSEVHSTKLKFSNNLLSVTASANEIGEAKDEVPIKFEGNEIEVVYNSTYLLDALKAIDDDEIIFNMNDSHSPAVIRCSIPFIYVIMPLRVD